MSCTKVGDFCKTVAERIRLRIPLSGGAFVKLFAANEIVAVGDFRRPKKPNGYEYEVTAGGQCEKGEPEWPLTVGLTVQSALVQFTCRAISNSSLARVVASVVWNGGTLTISDEAIVNSGGEQEISAVASAGALNDTGNVTAHITFNDSTVEDAILSYHVD